MKILITGANGYLGSGVVKSLLKLGHDVIATDLYTDNIPEKATIFKSNLFELENPYEYFGNPDVLLHMAWRDGFQHYSEAHIYDLPKHYEFLKKMIEAGVTQVSVMGSMHEIGFIEGSINENTPCNPLSYYGISKNALRNMVEILADSKKINFQWLRGFYIVGNTLSGSSIFSKLIAANGRGEKKFPFTLGQNQYDFIDYNDFCNQVALATEQNLINGIINICSGKPEKLADRVERFISDNNLEIRLEYGIFPDRPYDSKAVWGDNTKIVDIENNKKNLENN